MPRRKKKQQENSAHIDAVMRRIDECGRVINHIDSCEAWKIIARDLSEQKQQIDDNWQEITDEKRLQKARELKLAYIHLLSIKDRYAEDLKAAQKELRALENKESIIYKDFDTE